MLPRGMPFAHERWPHLGAALLLALLSSSLIREAREPAPLYADEAEWMTAGYVAYTLLRDRAPLERWDHAFDEHALGDWGNKNPPLGKYVIGWAIAAQVANDRDVNDRHAFRPERAPTLIAARTGIALCASVALCASYWLSYELIGSALWAALATLFLFFLPSFQFHAVRVYTDVPQIALLLCASAGMLRFARNGQWRWLIFALVCGGLACAVKFSAGAWSLGALGYCAWRSFERPRSLLPLMAALLIPLISFVAVNPFLYRDPLGRSLALAQSWQTSKANQRLDPQFADTVVQSEGRRFVLVSARGALAPTSTP
ncbi:MAG TPA: phospholipid carrier-dependent glycosyltransferase, partial [Polyangiales bacterium]|nr:phospholipid carrier-dependent glycosyltransferase [Polyangiales bacterium]